MELYLFFKSTAISVPHSILNTGELNKEEDFLSSSDCSYSSSSEEEEEEKDDVLCTPTNKTKSSRTLNTPLSSRKSLVHTPVKTPKKTVRFHVKELGLLPLSHVFGCLVPVKHSVAHLSLFAFDETLS